MKKAAFKINKGFIYQKVGDEVAIFDSDHSELLTFNETASYVFAQFKKGLTQDEIVDLVTNKYAVDKKKARKDISMLIQVMKRKHIIK